MNTLLHPLLAYGWWYGGWWWWWLVLLLFFWLLLLPPFGWGTRWYGTYRMRRGAGVPSADYTAQWQAVESHFESEPDAAVQEADGLVASLLTQTGNPPEVAERYRDAHSVTVKAQQHQATRDELRRAMMTFRALFDRLTPAR